MFDWLSHPLRAPDPSIERAARARQQQLTKPPGSLGRLEEIAIRLAALQHCDRPSVDSVWIGLFAADHGIARSGVSAYPQEVTAQMLANFARGGAAISVLARHLGACLEVVDVGVAQTPADTGAVVQARIAPGTANFLIEPAMDEIQLAAALNAGRAAVERAVAAGSRLFVGGEMGIGNTTSASALACALLKQPPDALTGPGTGLNAAGVARKREVIAQALRRHESNIDDARSALIHLGGFEIAALCGAYLACAQHGVAVLVDGFIAGVAALCAEYWRPGVAAWCFFAHRSGEPGHGVVLTALAAEPLLDLSLRLGEGSGAALAVPLLRAACALHNGMATFAEAGVAQAER